MYSVSSKEMYQLSGTEENAARTAARTSSHGLTVGWMFSESGNSFVVRKAKRISIGDVVALILRGDFEWLLGTYLVA